MNGMFGEKTVYSAGTKFFHWMIALLVLTMLSVSFFLSNLPKPYKPTAFMVHKSVGICILTLMLLRVFWIINTGRPSLPISMPAWERFLARAVQYSLYIFLILMPLSGWIMSVAADKAPVFFGLFVLPLPWIPHDQNLAHFMNQTHTVFAWIIIALLGLHISGALKHLLIDRDQILQRML